MKKSFFALFAALGLALAGCTPEAQFKIETLAATDITMHTATLNGRVSDLPAEGRVGFLIVDKEMKAEDMRSKSRHNFVELGEDPDFSFVTDVLEMGKTYYFVAFARIDGKFYFGKVLSFQTKEAEKTAVDIGIKVGGKTIKWASANLGAEQPYEYGHYYAWGEMETKLVYTQESYTYKKEPDNLTAAGRDVARALLGGTWRMPTEAELAALAATKDNSGYQWTLKNISGSTGYEIKYLAGNTSIFIPFGSNYNAYESRNYLGCYWGSTICTDPDMKDLVASALQIWEEEQEDGHTMLPEAIAAANMPRHEGCTIRPVCE